jgi:hypothetical protein
VNPSEPNVKLLREALTYVDDLRRIVTEICCCHTVRRVSLAMHQMLAQGVALRCMWCGRRMSRLTPQETSK